MRSPEEVEREIRRLTWDVLGNDGLVEEDGPALADLIRARDAEVAEAARAENARLREGIESVRVNALCAEEFLPRGSLALRETARKCAALLNPPTEGEK